MKLIKNHIHHCTRGIWLDWQAQGTRVTGNLFHDNIAPCKTNLEKAYEIGEDVFVEVSHGPTLIDHNVMLSPCSLRLSTQGIAVVHNLIAGSFTAVGECVNMNTTPYPNPRYTPYHVPHRTEIAGFMSILHGDARFYNNIFVQQDVREDLKELTKKLTAQGMKDFMAAPNLTCGTNPYDGYPTKAEYDAQIHEIGVGLGNMNSYYSRLPLYTGGNVFFNGAVPCEQEQDIAVQCGEPVFIRISKSENAYILETDIYEKMPVYMKKIIDSDIMGEAFEPEQRFENADGSELILNNVSSITA